jgi:hypothetical protein
MYEKISSFCADLSLEYFKTNSVFIFSRVATKLQSAYVLVKGGRADVSLSSLTR